MKTTYRNLCQSPSTSEIPLEGNFKSIQQRYHTHTGIQVNKRILIKMSIVLKHRDVLEIFKITV